MTPHVVPLFMGQLQKLILRILAGESAAELEKVVLKEGFKPRKDNARKTHKHYSKGEKLIVIVFRNGPNTRVSKEWVKKTKELLGL
jgi:hypothetical protein